MDCMHLENSKLISTQKYRRFIPVIVIFALIIFLTCQSREDTLRNSYRLRDYLIYLFPTVYGKWRTSLHWFRSLLHLPLYFLLGLLVQFSISNSKKAVWICCIASFIDETLKIFLPTREFEFRDLVIDAIGYMIGILIAALFLRCILTIRYMKLNE